MQKFLLFSLLSILMTTQGQIKDSIYSNSCKQWCRFNVLLPSKPSGSKVLYMLHGATGGRFDYLKRTNIAELSKKYPFIIVFPEAGMLQGEQKIGDTWFVNSPIASQVQWASYFKELHAYIHEKYKTAGAGIMGLSMGGYGSTYLACEFPQIIRSLSTMSACFDLKPIEKFGIPEIFGSHKQDEAFNLFKQAHKLRKTRVLISCGMLDKFYKSKENPLMVEVLQQNGVNCTANFTEGKHDWEFWNKVLESHLKFHLPKP